MVPQNIVKISIKIVYSFKKRHTNIVELSHKGKS